MTSPLFFYLISALNFFLVVSQEPKATSLKAQQQNNALKPYETYIVHVRLPDGVDHLSTFEYHENFYHSFLPKTTEGLNDVSRMVYSYRNVFTGFAAKLSPQEVKEMENKEGFLYARPDQIFSLHTTDSPRFMGMYRDHGVWPQSNHGKGVIIGMIDNGIKADHPSFSDEGMPDPPAKWKGICDLNGIKKCNKKLIGARNSISSGEPVGVGAHGTHTSSIAAGNFVKNANVLGNANGTAVGMAPLAHLAMYQACQLDSCAGSTIAAAMDAAILDAVDVLSISLGRPTPTFYDDTIGIGAFRAMTKGIFVSCSAGNNGPEEASLLNEAPWILTVGASSIDRNLRATALLGNNETHDGESLIQPQDFPPTMLPLVYPGHKNSDETAAKCLNLDKIDVAGKIVVCDDFSGCDQGLVVKRAGGAAMILVSAEVNAYTVDDEDLCLPATKVSFHSGQKIKAYINSTSTPTATILFKGTVLGVKNAPSVTSFSSRGPNRASPWILKPDVLGPGLNTLAAWPHSLDKIESETSAFNIISGTSMSSPHLGGIAAVLKSLHPGWSPAAIKSAIMTTANNLNLNHNPILDHRLLAADIFATGAGHVNPVRAAHPGLIYDIQPDDYIAYLCGMNYTDKQVEIIANRPVTCSSITSIPEGQLNYPSFANQLGPYTQTYTRTVTNVGKASSTYGVEIETIPGVDVYVDPDVLVFTDAIKKITYNISFARSDTPLTRKYVQGAITWISNEHRVRSPISIKFI